MNDEYLVEDEEQDDEEYVDDGTGDLDIEDSPLTNLEELRSRVARLVELRRVNDQAQTAAKKAKKELDEYQAEFFEEYRKSPLTGSIRVEVGDEVVQLVPRETKYGRVLDYDKARAYFKERNKDEEYIREEFRTGRLHELVREHIEQKKPLPDGIDFYTKEYFTVTIK